MFASPETVVFILNEYVTFRGKTYEAGEVISRECLLAMLAEEYCEISVKAATVQ